LELNSFNAFDSSATSSARFDGDFAVDGIARARFYRSEAIGSARDASRR
jgi:hypothetical protein